MTILFAHLATVTVRLPRDASLADEVDALRAAGIPVDTFGYVESGHLFQRTGSHFTVFRWFATSVDGNPKGMWKGRHGKGRSGSSNASQATSHHSANEPESPGAAGIHRPASIF